MKFDAIIQKTKIDSTQPEHDSCYNKVRNSYAILKNLRTAKLHIINGTMSVLKIIKNFWVFEIFQNWIMSTIESIQNPASNAFFNLIKYFSQTPYSPIVP